MELLNQIFPTWHIYLDVFLLGMVTYLNLRITKKNHYYFKNNNLKINLRKLQLLQEKS